MKRVILVACLFFCCSVYLDASNPNPINDGRVTVSAGVSIHYLQSGSPTSPHTLVLIPGWRLPAYMWSEQLKTFAPLARVIAIDPRSQGDSTKTTEGNSPEGRARDLHEVLAKLHVTQPILVGWSQGAQDVGAYIAQFGSDSIAGAVFVDSPVSIGPAEIEKHPASSKAILSGLVAYAAHPEEYSKGLVAFIFKKPHPDLDMNKLVQSTLKTPTDIGVAMLTLDIFGADRLTPLTKMTKPVLMIGAADSPFLNEEEQMAASVPGAKFIPIEGVGHAVFVDDPVRFDAALKEFLQGLSKSTTPQ